MAMLAVPQVERRMRGDVEEKGEFLFSFHPRVSPSERRFEVVSDMLVELLVLLFGDLRLGPCPQRRGLVNLLVFVLEGLFAFVRVPFLFLHQDRDGDVIGVLAQDGAQPESREQFVFAVAQMQSDVSAAAFSGHRFQDVVALPVAFPANAVLHTHPGAPRDEDDLIRHDERRIETDAELTDEMRVFGLVTGQALEELPCTGLGDGADVADHFVPRHPHAVIGHAQRTAGLVIAHPDLEVRIRLPQACVGEPLEAQLVAGVRRVGNELTKEDLLVAVERVHHQVQQLFDLGLETEGFPSAHFAHVLTFW